MCAAVGVHAFSSKSVQARALTRATGPVFQTRVISGVNGFLPWISFAATGVVLPLSKPSVQQSESWTGKEQLSNRDPSLPQAPSLEKTPDSMIMIDALYGYATLDSIVPSKITKRRSDKSTLDGFHHEYFKMHDPPFKLKDTQISCTKETLSDADALLQFALLALSAPITYKTSLII